MTDLFPKQMRYQAALLPDTGKSLGFRRFRRNSQVAVAADIGGTRREQAHRVPDYSRSLPAMEARP